MCRHGTLALVVVPALLAGCSRSEATSEGVDLNAAAKRAQRDIAGYAAARPGAVQVAALDLPSTVSARYRCDGSPDLIVEFDNVAQAARVWRGDGSGPVTLRQQPAASGMRYAGGGLSLSGKGHEALFSERGRAVRCRVVQ